MSIFNFDLDIKNYNINELRKLLDLEPPFSEEELMLSSDNIKNKILCDDTLSKDKKEKLINFILKTENILKSDMNSYFSLDLSNNLYLKRRDFLCIPEIENQPNNSERFLKWPKGASVLYYNKKHKIYEIYVKNSFVDEKPEWSIFKSH
tara:strand:+ start:1227 stop:1673 length:447 start_codon:yes stop_codon:yes gene_type:complete